MAIASSNPADPLPARALVPRTAPPPCRRLRAYAFDPSLDTQLESAVINQVTLQAPWEDRLRPGPVGEYVEVVDYDPAGGCFYDPVDLNRPDLLAQDGLAPSEGTPQFHQQMVYAVAMLTIRNFEVSLGRRALWASRRHQEGGSWREEPVPRLRIYPHALREANAYYSPAKKALLFGYFPASQTDPGHNLPGGLVFTCLSHDIVAHETTHALLDGMHDRFGEATNPDSLAFHEAFADIVALFQHFSLAEVLRDQIARTRGDLREQNLLGQLAQQFGEAVGQYGALRDAIGQVNPKTRQWEPRKPDPADYRTLTEAHARGAILVAAVFDAFLSIYKSRVADLLRIATGGSGVLAAGELHPDLVNRLASEAAKSARHVCTMCIRALDYCPPVDVTFGDYLRALITADFDLVPDDDLGYRIAFIEAFRRRGIYPVDVRTLSVESLRWQDINAVLPEEQRVEVVSAEGRGRLAEMLAGWNLRADRGAIFERACTLRGQLHDWFRELAGELIPEVAEPLTGLALNPATAPRTIARDDSGLPVFEVHSVRPARRVGPDGQLTVDLVLEITQRRNAYFDPRTQEEADRASGLDAPADFTFRGGCTVIVNMETGEPRYVIRKGILAGQRLEEQRRFRGRPDAESLRATYFGDPLRSGTAEPFALLHRGP
jgi:hypothetical protein